MNKAQPTYSLFTRQDMDALYGTRPATSAMQTVQCPEGYVSYTIQAGDTLRSIAQTYGITVTELLFYNPELNPYGYRAGDLLCVPGATSTSDQPEESEPAQPDEGPNGTPTPSLPGENQPAQPDEGPNGTPTPSLPGENQPAQPGEGPEGLPTPSLPPIGTPTPSLPIVPDCPNGMLYTVRAGDTLRSIAQRFDITLDSLMNANPGQTNNRLIIGQQLCIPRALCPACCAAGDTVVRIRSTNFVDYLVTYNVSYAALAAANPNVNLDALTPGRQLCIPPIGSRGSCAEGMGTLELAGDFSAQALAERLNTTVSELMRHNPNYTPRDFTRGRIVCVPPTLS